MLIELIFFFLTSNLICFKHILNKFKLFFIHERRFCMSRLFKYCSKVKSFPFIFFAFSKSDISSSSSKASKKTGFFFIFFHSFSGILTSFFLLTFICSSISLLLKKNFLMSNPTLFDETELYHESMYEIF